MNNICLLTDAYKISQSVQYPSNTTKVYSYLESRGGKFKETTFFGLQYLIKKYLCGINGQVFTKDDIDDAERFCKYFFGRGDVLKYQNWKYILDNDKEIF